MKKDNKQEIHRESVIKFVKRAGQFCETSWKNGKQIQRWFDCEHKAVHNLHCLSCGKKVREIAK